MNTYLFVGGPEDGKRLEADGSEYWRIIKRIGAKEPNFRPEQMSPEQTVEYDEYHYVLQRFHGEKGHERYEVYFHQSIKGGFMAALIHGYRAPENVGPQPIMNASNTSHR